MVIKLYRGFGLGILQAQFPNGAKKVLFGEEALLLQDLDQGRHFPHAGDSEFFEGDDFFGVEGFGREAHDLAVDGPPLAYRIIRLENVTKVGFS